MPLPAAFCMIYDQKMIFLLLQPHRILQSLKRYVRAENKDRLHTIRHYQHVLTVDPEKAAQMKSQVSAAQAHLLL